MPGIHGADKFAEKLKLFQGAADQFNLGQGAAEQFGLNKGAAEMFNFDQGAGSVFGAGMSNPGNPLYSGVQQKLQQQEGVNNPFGFAGQFINFIKQGGGKLMDRYRENERLKQEYRDQNPGGYPGMPQNLRERMRRNEMGIGNQSNFGGGNLIAGYDPDFPSDDNALREALRGYRKPDGSSPAKLGSDVFDILVRQGRV